MLSAATNGYRQQRHTNYPVAAFPQDPSCLPSRTNFTANDLYPCRPELVATLTECPGHIAWLLEALDRYDSNGHYDEVFWEAHRQIADHGDAGKAEICLVVC